MTFSSSGVHQKLLLSLKAAAHNFCIFQHKITKGVSLGMGKGKP